MMAPLPVLRVRREEAAAAAEVEEEEWRRPCTHSLRRSLCSTLLGRLDCLLGLESLEALFLLLLLSLLSFQLGRSLLVLDVVLELEIVMFESLELRVVQPRFNVERQRYVFEDIGTHCLVIILHI